MNMKPRISVLMPAYNASKFIDESIQSILDQTCTDFELIIIDDCSTDNTWEKIQDYVGRHGRIRAYKNEKNFGISITRNRLIHHSLGEYIVWQDADDVSLPYRIEHQLEYMQENSQVGICGGFLELFDNQGVQGYRSYDLQDEDLRKKIFRQSPVAQGASMIRKSIIDKVGLIDESLSQAEDLDLSLRIGKVSKFANLQEVVLRYRQNDQSITKTKLSDNIRQTLIVRERARKLYGYKISPLDKVSCVITFMFRFVPPSFTHFVFNKIRNG